MTDEALRKLVTVLKPFPQQGDTNSLQTWQGKVVFEVGTDNSDDYYPSYFMNTEDKSLEDILKEGRFGMNGIPDIIAIYFTAKIISLIILVVRVELKHRRIKKECKVE